MIGDSLGSLVEFKDADEIARLYPGGVRELADGGVYHTIAGQPTDDSEMALALARSLVGERAFQPERFSRSTASGCRRARSTSARPPSAGCSDCTPPIANRTAR